MRVMRGVSLQFRAAYMVYWSLRLLDGLVALLTLGFVDMELESDFGAPLLWRAL